MNLIATRTASTFLRVLTKHRWFLGLVAFHSAAALLASQLSGVPFSTRSIEFLLFLFTLLVPVFLIVLFGWRLLYLAVVVKTDQPLKWFLNDLKVILFDSERLISGAIALAAISFFFPAFSYMKDLVAVFQDFPWDQTFAAWDRALHFGADPYQWLMPVFGSPYAITALNATYHFWLFLLYFVIFVAAFTKVNPQARMQFLITLVLTWGVGGNLIAIWLSSAGPIYYERLGFGSDFVPLTDHLVASARISPVWAHDVQEMLWAGFMGSGGPSGISAMPSMHVASSVSLTLYAFTWQRWAGRVTMFLTAMVMIGSVMLAWHYAIDGYLGALIALASWHVAGRIVARD